MIGEDGIDWNHLSQEELYEMAKQEGGVVKIYATTTDADTARKKIARDYPDLNFEFVSCDTNTIKSLLERDYDAGKVNADVNKDGTPAQDDITMILRAIALLIDLPRY